MKKILSFVIALLLFAGLVGCSQYVDPNQKQPPKDLTINGGKGDSEFLINEKANLHVTTTTTGNIDLKVTWVSTNPSVATISADGELTCLANGETEIVATSTADTSISAKIKVKVSKAVADVKAESLVINGKKDIKVGDQEQLTVTFTPENTTNKNVTWETKDENIVSIDATGKMTALKEGTTTITATSSGNIAVTATLDVTVTKVLPTSIKVNGKQTIEIDEEATLTVVMQPANTTDTSVTWSSDNEDVVTVDEAGKAKGLALGKAVITATSTADSTIKGTIEITVANEIEEVLPTEIKIEGNNKLSLGESSIYSATVLPANATDPTVKWSTSDANIATIDQNGKLTTVRQGTVTITATSNAVDTVKGTLEITVSAVLVTGIVINGTDKLSVEKDTTLTVVITPTNATDPSVTWSSSNSSIATVDEEGKVTAISEGTVTIKATSKDGSNVEATFDMTIQPKVETVEPTSITITGVQSLAQNTSRRLTATVLPAGASQNVVWSSSNSSIISIDPVKGKMQANNTGTVTITATCADFPEIKQTYEVNVPIAKPEKVITVEELQAAAALESDGKIHVKFRIPFGTNIQSVMNGILETFHAEYPYIQVDLDVLSGYDPMKEATVLDLQAGTAPTVAVGYPDHFASYLVGKGIIALDSFIKDPNVGIWDQEKCTFVEEYNFYDDYIKENVQYDVAGSYYGLPFNKSTELLIYNKTFFEAYELEVPETWEEAEQVSRQIVEFVKEMEGINPDEYVFGGVDLFDFYTKGTFMPFTWDSTSNLFITAIRQWGGKYTEATYNADGSTNLNAGKSMFNNPEAIAALKYLQGLSKDKLFNVPEKFEKTYASDLFKAGQCIMTVGSSAGISYNGGGVGEMGVAPIPYNSNNTENGKQVIQQGTNIAIFSQASDAERLAAWLMIKYFLSPEQAAIFSIGTAYFPVSESARNTNRYQQFLTAANTDDAVYYIPEGSTEPEGAQFNKAYAQAALVDYKALGFTFFTDPAWAGSSAVRTQVGTAMSQILVVLTDVEQAIKDALNKLQ